MRKFQTAAHSADDQLTELLGVEGRLYKEDILNDHQIVPIRLVTTYEEAMLLLFEKSIVRPGFKINDKSIDYPCLFFKVNGAVDDLVNKAHAWRAANTKTTLLYSNFHMIGRAPQPTALQSAEQTASDANNIAALSYLSQFKKEQLNIAIQNTLEWAKDCKIDLSETEIYATCLYQSDVILDAFHNVNPAASNAKCFINSTQKNEINYYAAVRLLFMHALGFDVVVISKNSYASIENIILDKYFDLHTLAAVEQSPKPIGCSPLLIALAIAGIIIMGYFMFGIRLPF